MARERAVSVCFVLLTVVALAAACSSGADDAANARPNAASTTLPRSNDLPLLAPADLPPDLAGVGRQGEVLCCFEPAVFSFFGDADDDPFDPFDLKVTVDTTDDLPAMNDGLVVRGTRPAARWSETRIDAREARGVYWVGRGVGLVFAASVTLAEEEVLEIVDLLVFDGDHVDIGDNPFDLALVGRADFPGNEDAYALRYVVDAGRSLSVSVQRVREHPLTELRWRGAVLQNLNGRDVVRWTVPSGQVLGEQRGIAWEDEPGVLVELFAIGLTEQELEAAATSMEPLSREQFDALPSDG